MTRMIHNKFGCVSPTENRCLGDLERWLKAKKRREQEDKKKPSHDSERLKRID
ncbi:hypothetical protein [Levilactobacillus brevis]|uniref:hypothetical protein n=1 Tax=Levilactobacillus brevis TaxID=1580 RepID=UPI0015CF8252|nr:hypothetical protein [Levilactobacillus brevis]MCZ2120142.1 hypothetical protein [Levilactobacillus brevis]MCZ2125638.1 hypothetical protein [Levilactobacillus brevis]MCZ2209950.1 hypothetical protein [Levilactobacillus brevis]MCZ2325422.1 hypothetical protein [Levilactobacillus brevis]